MENLNRFLITAQLRLEPWLLRFGFCVWKLEDWSTHCAIQWIELWQFSICWLPLKVSVGWVFESATCLSKCLCCIGLHVFLFYYKTNSCIKCSVVYFSVESCLHLVFLTSTVPSKSSWTLCKLTETVYQQNSSHPMQNNQFSAKNDAGFQIIWIEDQAPRSVGPDLDPYCLKRSFRINIFLEIVGKYFHFVRELLEGTVHS